MKKQQKLSSFFKKASAPLPVQEEENIEVNAQENVGENVHFQNERVPELVEVPVAEPNADPEPSTSSELDLFERGFLYFLFLIGFITSL